MKMSKVDRASLILEILRLRNAALRSIQSSRKTGLEEVLELQSESDISLSNMHAGLSFFFGNFLKE